MDPDAAVDAGLGHYVDDPLIFAADFDRLRVFFESQGTRSVRDPGGRSDRPGNNSSAGPVAGRVRAELAATLHWGDSVHRPERGR